MIGIIFRYGWCRLTTCTLAALAILCSPITAYPDSTEVMESIPRDTESLIDRKGLPVARVPVEEASDGSHLLLYDDGDTVDGLLIDVAYLIDENGEVENKIVRTTSRNRTEEKKEKEEKEDEEAWYSETVSELKETAKSLKETKKSIDRNINALPGLNYFDRVEVLSDEMEFEIGKSSNETRTTFVYEPSKDYVSFTLRVPLGP